MGRCTAIVGTARRHHVLGPGRRLCLQSRRASDSTTSRSWWGRRISWPSTASRCIPTVRSRVRSGRSPSMRQAAAVESAARARCRSRPPSAHAREHSLEMQLPFLGRLLPGLPIVPLLMGHQIASTIERLSSALAAALAWRRALLVASTDLSHYFDAETAARARWRSLRRCCRLRSRAPARACSKRIRRIERGRSRRLRHRPGDRGDDGRARARRAGRAGAALRAFGRGVWRRRRASSATWPRQWEPSMLTEADAPAARRPGAAARSQHAWPAGARGGAPCPCRRRRPACS